MKFQNNRLVRILLILLVFFIFSSTGFSLSITSISINSSNLLNQTNENISVYVIANHTPNITYVGNWYLNDSIINSSNFSITNQTPNNLIFLSTLQSNSTSENSIVKACVTPYQADNLSIFNSTVCSENMSILSIDTIVPNVDNILPVANLDYVVDETIQISSEISDNRKISMSFVNLSLPNSTTITLSLIKSMNSTYLSNYTIPSVLGRYNLTFFVNDSSNLANNSAVSHFNVFNNVSFNFSYGNSHNFSQNFSLKVYSKDRLIYDNNNTNGTLNISLINSTVDIVYLAFNNSFSVTLKNISVLNQSNKVFDLDRYINLSDYLIVYAVNNSYNISSATVKLFYSDLSVIDEDNLKIFKCDNYNFTDRVCNSTFIDITSSTIQNDSLDYFEFNVSSFSAFGILQDVVVLSSDDTSTITSVGWNITNCGDDEVFESDGSICVQKIIPLIPKIVSIDLDYEPEVIDEIPKELFDITFTLEESIISDIKELSGLVTFVSFGSIPTPVNYSFSLYDSNGNIIMTFDGSIVVETENVIVLNFDEFNDLDLDDGDYSLVYSSTYNIDVKDDFIQDFKIDSKPEVDIFNVVIGYSFFILFSFSFILLIYKFKVRKKKHENFEFRLKKNHKRIYKMIFLILISAFFLVLVLVSDLNSVSLSSSDGDIRLYVKGIADGDLSYGGEWYKNGDPLMLKLWDVSIEVFDLEIIHNSVFDSEDNLYVLSSNPNSNFKLAKYGRSGDKLFGLLLEPLKDWKIISDSEDNLYLGGIDGGVLKVFKFDSDGEETFAKSYSLDEKVLGFEFGVDSKDNLYVVFEFFKKGKRDILVKKFDSNGDELWSKNLKKTNLFETKISFNSKDEVYITSNYHKSKTPKSYVTKFDFKGKKIKLNDGPTSTSKTTGDVFISEFMIGTNDEIYMLGYDEFNIHLFGFDSEENLKFKSSFSLRDSIVDFSLVLDGLNNLYLSVLYNEDLDSFIDLQKLNSNGENIYGLTEKLGPKISRGDFLLSTNAEFQVVGFVEDDFIFLNRYKSSFISLDKSSNKKVLIDKIDKDYLVEGDEYFAIVVPYLADDVNLVGVSDNSHKVQILKNVVIEKEKNISVDNISVDNISVDNISVDNISVDNISVDNISVDNIIDEEVLLNLLVVDIENKFLDFSIDVIDGERNIKKLYVDSPTRLNLSNELVDLKYSLLNGSVVVKLNDLFSSDIQRKRVSLLSLDKYSGTKGHLVTYGIENNMDFKDAYVEFDFSDLNYSNADNLRVLKCNDYNFASRKCNTIFENFGGDFILNKFTETISLVVDSFSGFGIVELKDEVIGDVVPTQNISVSNVSKLEGFVNFSSEDLVESPVLSGSNYFGIFCEYGYRVVDEELLCIEKVYDTEILFDMNSVGEQSSVIIPGVIVEKVELFDIDFTLYDYSVKSIQDLFSKTTIENFGTGPSEIFLKWEIYDSAGILIYLVRKTLIVETQEFVVQDFSKDVIELSIGDYAVILTTRYGDDVTDHFVQNFNIVEDEDVDLYDFSITSLVLISVIFLSSSFALFKIAYLRQKTGNVKNEKKKKNKIIKEVIVTGKKIIKKNKLKK